MLTTCASDYVTWRNELRRASSTINGVTVRRFPRRARARSARLRPALASASSSSRIRSPTSSSGSTPRDRRARRSSAHRRSTRPTTTSACSSAIATTTRTTARGPPPRRRVLVPTAERDRGDRPVDVPAGLPRRARAHVQLARRARDDPGRRRGNQRRAVGRRRHRIGGARRPAAGSLPPEVRHPRTVRDLRRAASTRTRAARSCSTSSSAICSDGAGQLSLVLIGNRCCRCRSTRASAISAFSTISDKFDAMAAAELLIMPSYFESLSMVALEAWALGKPVLANGRCDVLKGQCIRSNAGLYYETLGGVRRDAARARAATAGSARARPERPAVLPRPLRLAGHRAEVSRHVRAAVEGAGGRDGAAARLVRAAQPTVRRRGVVAALPAGPVPPAIETVAATPACRVAADRRSHDRTPARRPQARRRGRRRVMTRAVRPSTRCWRRSATATRSATRCSASSACCARPATSRRSSSRPRTAGSSR